MLHTYFYTPEDYYNMFTPEFFIDVVQNTKRAVTNKVITDPTLNKAALNYIDSQTQFAKMLTQNAVNIAKYSLDSMSDSWFPKKKAEASSKA